VGRIIRSVTVFHPDPGGGKVERVHRRRMTDEAANATVDAALGATSVGYFRL